jgi:hypothetical protein
VAISLAFATEVAVSLAFATEVAVSLTFTDAPVYVFYCVLSACVPNEGALKQSTRALLAHKRGYPAP